MCICLNCERINSCKVYYTIEQENTYNQGKKDDKKNFSPQSPILFCINFFSTKDLYMLEWDVGE